MARKKLKYITKAKFFNLIQTGKWKTFIDHVFDAGFDINTNRIKGNMMLSLAAEYGDREVVEYLSQKGADSNVKNYDGTKPLHTAAKYGHQDVVEFFINIGVCVNSRDNNNRTPLHYAAETFHRQVVKPLQSNDRIYRNFNNTTINCPSSEMHKELVYLLLVNGADFDAGDRKGNVPLLLAAQRLCVDVVKLLVMWGAKVDCCDGNKRTALHYASFAGWLDVVQSLIDRGSDVNAVTCSGVTPLIFAIQNSHRAIFDLLVKSGADLECCDNRKRSVLHHACKTGWLDVAQSLVERGCDINAETCEGDTPLLLAARHSRKEIFGMLFKTGAHLPPSSNKKPSTLLHFACAVGCLDVVQVLVKAGSDINAKTFYGETPLLLAACFSHIDIFDYLIDAGADVDVNIPSIYYYSPTCERYSLDFDCEDVEEWKLLHYASYNGWLQVVMSLTKKGIDVDVRNFEGDTPLHLAIRGDNLEIVKHLLKAGADCNMQRIEFNTPKTFKSDTPLHLAVKGNNLEIVKHLLNAGADCNIRSSNGTVLECFIEECRSAEVIRLFIENGAHIHADYYYRVNERAFFKEGVLKDAKLCTQAIINEFNNLDLEEVYGTIMALEYLPPIDRMKMTNNGNRARCIEQSVKHDIETQGYCNIAEIRPMVLSLMCVRSFIRAYI